MPTDKRQMSLRDRLESEVLPHFAERILRFDVATSQFYSDLMARARASGKALGKADGYIVATATANGFTVATRDSSPFEAAGLKVINPWFPKKMI